jgi:cysteinyl-tRNA synthetase
MKACEMNEPSELKLYNTLTRTKEVLEPIDRKNVRMYVCGPTVYDFAHIGNARPVIVFDVLFRLLRHLYGEDHVTYVRNITDVDDKINARALRDFGDQIEAGKLSLNEAIRKVTEKTANQFHADVKALGCLEPTHEPRATDFVLPRGDGKSDMVTLIQQLLDKGHAYVATGNDGREVLFDVTSMKEYGALSNRKLEDQQAGARIAVESHKNNPGDFVLWKESDADQPGWDGKFTAGGETVTIHGRPGWHIECSAMSAALLGETFDIHGGGLDLIFPHHENEIAQSCCAHGTSKMANYWMHNGYLQVEGKKMSKSDGNFVTIDDLLNTEKFGDFKWPGAVLRYAMLKTHYREPIDFTVCKLEEASNELTKFKMLAVSENTVSPSVEFIIQLSNDLSTPAAIAFLHNLAKDINVLVPNIVDSSEFHDGTDKLDKSINASEELVANLKFLGIDILSFDPDWFRKSRSIFTSADPEYIQKQISQRLAYIADKNFAEADRIRDELLAQGIQLKDSKDSQTGERVTTWEVKR